MKPIIDYKQGREEVSLNPAQGSAKRVLCICLGGVLRSPTAAVVLSQPPYNFNTRAVGVDPIVALIPVSEVLIHWAQEIVVMESWQATVLKKCFDLKGKRVVCLNIPDRFKYRDPVLMKLIRERYDAQK